MVFIKITKNKSYFKRFQTKFRRRRECKTDYQSRQALVVQDLNKYLAPKYRLVARITNARVIAQIIYSTYEGDRVLSEADSFELKRYGLTNGLTSYPAAYATGLLLARRTLDKLKMADQYKPVSEIDGKHFNVENNAHADRRPFVAVLDVGLRRPTIGNRVFAVMKGACDGGISVPHSVKKFPGFSRKDKKDKKGTYESEAHKDRIFGAHIDEQLEAQKEGDDKETKNNHLGLWKNALKTHGVESVEDLFKKVFDGILKNHKKPEKAKRERKPEFKNKEKTEVVSKKAKKGVYTRKLKLTNEQRKAAAKKKIDDLKALVAK